MAEIKYVSQENLSRVLAKIKETYVVKVDGKGLSTNDLTNELLAKINGMGTVATLNEITEDNLAAALKEKVNAAAEGNHSHNNKALLDTYTQTEENLADAVAKKHAHANATELDKLADGDKAKWDQAVADVATVGGKVTTLIGDDANKSVRTIANEELAKQLIPEGAAESLNELQEIAAWIQSHPGDASAMNAAIVALQNQLKGIDAGEGTVKTYIDGAISSLNIGDYAKAADLTALAARVVELENAKHTHANKEELDKIVAGDKAKWDAVAADYVKASELKAFTNDEIDAIWNAANA